LNRLDFDLTSSTLVLTGMNARDIHYDTNNDIFYIISYPHNSIRIFTVQNDITFTQINSFNTPPQPVSLAFYSNEIYVGTELGNIFVYNSNYVLFKNMTNICNTATPIFSIKFDSQGNMFYTCSADKSIKILYANGVTETIAHSSNTYGVLPDSNNKLWVTEAGRFYVYN
jgi:outer membrane protein assembly factor BamB